MCQYASVYKSAKYTVLHSNLFTKYKYIINEKKQQQKTATTENRTKSRHTNEKTKRNLNYVIHFVVQVDKHSPIVQSGSGYLFFFLLAIYMYFPSVQLAGLRCISTVYKKS